MKARFWLPAPTAWLSAVLLYVFLSVWGIVAARVVPQLIELLRSSPRLAVLGGLALWLGPILLIALVNQAAHAMLDGLDPKEKLAKGIVPSLRSWWAGVFAWLVMFFASSTTTFLLLLVFPPRPPEPDVMAYVHEALVMQRQLSSSALVFGDAPGQGTVAMMYVGTWVALAAWLFNLEKMTREK